MAPFLSSSTRAALQGLLALDEPQHPPPPLERLQAIRTLLAELDSDPAQVASVRAALDDGASWHHVAGAAGLKPAAAKFRWQGTDADIEHRRQAGRKRSARPSSVPTDLPGLSVADEARRQGVTAQAVYQQITRGLLASRSVELPDGRTYKRVFPADAAPSGSAGRSPDG